MASGRRCCRASGTGAGARLGTRCPVSSGHPRCREQATCVHGLGHCEPPDGRRGNNSAPGCGVRSRAIRGSPADHIEEGKKSCCRVTTRRRNLWVFNGLGRGLGPLTALALCLGMPGFDLGGLAMFGLPPRRLPAADLPPTFQQYGYCRLRLNSTVLLPMPPQDRGRLNNSGQTEQPRPQPGRQHQQRAITTPQPKTWKSSPQGDVELMTESMRAKPFPYSKSGSAIISISVDLPVPVFPMYRCEKRSSCFMPNRRLSLRKSTRAN